MIGFVNIQTWQGMPCQVCMLYHSSTKMKFCNFPKTGPKPLDILEGLWHNTPVADNDEQTASDKQTS